MQNTYLISGGHLGKRIQFPYRKLRRWNIPDQLTKCYWNESGKFIT